LGKSSFFQFETRLKINLSRFHTFVSKPQCNHRTINTVLEKIHCRAVSEHVRRNAFVFQSGAPLACEGNMFSQKILNSILTQSFATRIGEECIRGLTIPFAQPDTQCRDCFLPQGNAPGFASLPDATYVSTGVESKSRMSARILISGLLAVLAGTAATVCTASEQCAVCESCKGLICKVLR